MWPRFTQGLTGTLQTGCSPRRPSNADPSSVSFSISLNLFALGEQEYCSPRAARCVHVFLGVVLLSKTISVYQQNRFGCRCKRERVEGIWDYQTAACVIWTCAAITQNQYVRLLVLLWMCRVSSWSVGAVTSGGTSRNRVEGVATLGVNLQINLFSIQHRRLQNSVRTRDKKTTC